MPSRLLARSGTILVTYVALALTTTAQPTAHAADCPGTSSAYADAVRATSGLAAYHRLGERSGQTACDSAGTSTGTYSGGVALGRPGAIAGDGDTAAAFNGTTGYVRALSTASLNPSGALSIEAWVKPAATGRSQTLVRKDGQYLLRLYGGRLVFRLWSTSFTSVELISSSVVTAAVWQHVVAVYDGATMRLYRNGLQVAQRSRSGGVRTGSGSYYLGASRGIYDFLGGELDEVALYRSALPASMVARHHEIGKPEPDDSAPGDHASVTCGLGTFRVGLWPSACWRPYADSSPFNRRLPASPRVVANSSDIVRRILGMGPIADMTVAPDTPSDWYHPTYYARPTDPLYTVRCVRYSCEIDGMQVRIPAQARPAGGGDAHMTVVDQATGWEWDFWQVRDKPAGGGTLTISAGGRTAIAGDGLGSDANAGQWGLLGGVIRAQEMEAGRIDHALFMMVGCTRRAYVYPAQGLAATCADQINAPATGQHLQLAMTDTQIDVLAVPAWKKTILRALARYGGFVGDTGGNEAFALQFESGSTYTSFGFQDRMIAFAQRQTSGVSYYNGKWYFDLAGGVDWARYLRVLDPCVARGGC
jgi:Concanavalin A-like lectin/glucanases superfamily